MRTVTRSTGHSKVVNLTTGQTLTINSNPDRTLLRMRSTGTNVTLSVTVGSGDTFTIDSAIFQEIGTFLSGDLVLTSKIVITTDNDTEIAMIISDPNNVVVT